MDLVVHGRHRRIRSKDSDGNETPRGDRSTMQQNQAGRAEGVPLCLAAHSF